MACIHPKLLNPKQQILADFESQYSQKPNAN